MKVQYEIKPDLIRHKTIGEIKNIDFLVRSKGGSKEAGIDQEIAIASMYICRELLKYDFDKGGLLMTLEQFYKMRIIIAQEFIHLHRLNYMTYCHIQEIYDWLEEKGRAYPNVKRFWKKVEITFSNYQSQHKKIIDHSAWMTIQDHVRLASDTIQPLIEPLEFAVRDYLIQKRPTMLAAGQKDDITLLSKVETGLLFCAALRNTYRRFFDGCRQKYGCDFSVDFKYADISAMGRNFVWMMEQLGVRFVKDKDGDSILVGVDVEKSLKVEQAWDRIVDIVTDEDKMDETALAAIKMNPDTKADYDRIIAKDEDRAMKVALGDLRSKFKVGKL